ncbi:MAG: hypothetical protein Q8877_03610, partial [Sweet potato little leaf phytoplasma]|nr:hypothetical protein [Sweet potato little leaf phytoplasma]
QDNGFYQIDQILNLGFTSKLLKLEANKSSLKRTHSIIHIPPPTFLLALVCTHLNTTLAHPNKIRKLEDYKHSCWLILLMQTKQGKLILSNQTSPMSQQQQNYMKKAHNL